jgi:thiol:disulfide interchange protein DsbD
MPLSAFVVAGVIAAAIPADEPLEPELAFPLVAGKVAAGVELRFNVREGYYLYANRFRVEAPGFPEVRLRIPDGIDKDDAFVGRSRILKGDVTLLLTLPASISPGEYEIHVTAQGCAEQRVCYAPFTQSAMVRLP